MKSISIALAVAVAVACVYSTQSASVPSSPHQVQAEQLMDPEVSEQEQLWTEAAVRETRPEEVLFRTRRQSHLSLCRYCCNCCKNKGCGFCCRF